MLLVDSNVFIYARRDHEYSESCVDFVRRAADEVDWFVPAIVLLELTHYFGDNGAFAERIGGVFPVAELTAEDLFWAAAHSGGHEAFNDHAILHVAHRIGAESVVTYDSFFEEQERFEAIGGVRPGSGR